MTSPALLTKGDLERIRLNLRGRHTLEAEWAEMLLQHIAALEQRVEALQDIVRSHANGRCYACNWTLAENRDKGCVPGDCSFRPHSSDPEHAKWLERANFERAAIALPKEPR